MTVTATNRKAGPYPGNGVATSFPFSFKVFAKTDIAVVFANSSGVESTLVLDSDYSVTLNADQNTTPGGSITYPISGSPMLSTQALAIVGGLGYGQTTALPSGGAYNASIVERALDRLTILVQQVLEIANRGVQLAFTTATNVSSRLPAPRAFSVLGWSSDGLSMTNYDPGTLGVSVSYAAWQTQTFNGTGAQTAFVLTNDAGVASNCDVVVGGVAQTPGINFGYDSPSKTITFLTGAPPTGTNNVVVRYGQALPQGTTVSANITDSTSLGRSLLTAISAAAARTLLGAQAAGDGTGILSLPSLTSPISLIALRSYLAGCTLSTAGASATMSVAAGAAMDSTNAFLMQLAATSKTTSVWAVGSGVGGLDTGAIANSTWYYFYAIRRPDTGVVDVVFSANSTSPTLPNNYAQFRYIGAGLTNGSGQWVKFTQTGDEFWWDTPVLDFNGAGSTTAALLTCSLPRGRKMKGAFNTYGSGTSGFAGIYLSDPSNADLAPSSTAAPLASFATNTDTGNTNGGGMVWCWTNTSGQARHREGNTRTTYIATLGWTDLRGKDL